MSDKWRGEACAVSWRNDNGASLRDPGSFQASGHDMADARATAHGAITPARRRPAAMGRAACRRSAACWTCRGATVGNVRQRSRSHARHGMARPLWAAQRGLEPESLERGSEADGKRGGQVFEGPFSLGHAIAEPPPARGERGADKRGVTSEPRRGCDQPRPIKKNDHKTRRARSVVFGRGC
jgi:hypothetical protein